MKSFILTVIALFLVYSGVTMPLSLAGVVMLRRKRSPSCLIARLAARDAARTLGRKGNATLSQKRRWADAVRWAENDAFRRAFENRLALAGLFCRVENWK